ncbi:hypothetical protein C8Q75DRAFT_811745 [Abortiporus biennis]|nr:hypothetical protein C8Q75DRAFT_811745 [Abortiporus biennis]
MSSTSSSLPPPPTGSAGNNSGQGTLPALSSSAALYLYTFLATLVLLLTVSAAIVFRSYILRRRQRLLIEEAIRNGTYVPPTRRRRINPSDKPILHEVHLVAVTEGHHEMNLNLKDEKEELADDESVGEILDPLRRLSQASGKERMVEEQMDRGWWNRLMPIAACLTNPPSSLPSVSTTETSPPINATQIRMLQWYRHPSRYLPFTLPFAHPQEEHLSPSPSPIPPINPPPSTTIAHTTQASQVSTVPQQPLVQLAFVVAMPCQQIKKQYHDDDEDELPQIELGISTVPYPPSKPGDSGDIDLDGKTS